MAANKMYNEQLLAGRLLTGRRGGRQLGTLCLTQRTPPPPRHNCNPNLGGSHDPDDEVPLAREPVAVPCVVVVQGLMWPRAEESVRLLLSQTTHRRRRQQTPHAGESDDTTACELLVVKDHAGR